MLRLSLLLMLLPLLLRHNTHKPQRKHSRRRNRRRCEHWRRGRRRLSCPVCSSSLMPHAQRTPLEVLRTDTPLFQKYVEARRNRHEAWFVEPAGHIELCNVAIPVRTLAAKP